MGGRKYRDGGGHAIGGSKRRGWMIAGMGNLEFEISNLRSEISEISNLRSEI
jgi:hypothetical protein